MNELKNWTDVTRGLYRYVIAAGVCYEIHIMGWRKDCAVETAHARLYLVGDWVHSSGVDYFEREGLHEGSVYSCIKAASQDNEANNKDLK